MAQNRNKLIDLFVGNLSNHVVHKILEKAVDDKELAGKYEKEFLNSFEIAKRYRKKINPMAKPFPEKDAKLIKGKITNKVRTELLLRISRGYKNIDLDLVDELIDNALKDSRIT